jgi:uncharacterized membrane protein
MSVLTLSEITLVVSLVTNTASEMRSPDVINVEKSVVINRPVDEVFAFVGDQRNTPRWQHGLVEVKRLTDGPPGIGTKHTFVRSFMGRRMEASNEYVAYEPGRIITFKTISGPVPLEASYLFEPVAGGTQLTSKIAMDAKGLVSLAEPLIARSLRREMDAAFVALKGLLEGQAIAIPLEAAAH